MRDRTAAAVTFGSRALGVARGGLLACALAWGLVLALLCAGCSWPLPDAGADTGADTGEYCPRASDLEWCLPGWDGCLHLTCEEVEANHFMVADATVRGAGLYVWPAAGHGSCEDRGPSDGEGSDASPASQRPRTPPGHSHGSESTVYEWGAWDVWPEGWSRSEDGLVYGSPGACPEGGLVKLAVGGNLESGEVREVPE